MSASTELLLEQINDYEKSLTEAAAAGDQTRVVQIRLTLDQLRQQLSIANRALNENKQLLKS